jgi:2-methylcitrate dehydratase PrpD
MGQDFIGFVTGLAADAIPGEVKAVLRRSFADTMMVAAAGSTTEMSKIAREFACGHWLSAPAAGRARMLFDGREAAAAGAAFAGAFTIDSIDGHDGNSRVKGHAGSALVPGLLAIADARRATGAAIAGRDFMAALAIGYEVAYRAGLALHGTAADYHTSGAWTAVGLAAAAGRMLGLDGERIRHAAGIAEYHGPRSPMMRCIDHPTMLRDGVGWGAPTGVSAAYMAALGFTRRALVGRPGRALGNHGDPLQVLSGVSLGASGHRRRACPDGGAWVEGCRCGAGAHQYLP